MKRLVALLALAIVAADYFAGDAGAGDTNGQGVGDVWFAVDVSGNAVN